MDDRGVFMQDQQRNSPSDANVIFISQTETLQDSSLKCAEVCEYKLGNSQTKAKTCIEEIYRFVGSKHDHKGVPGAPALHP